MGRLILITNDDGIDAGGIRQLAETAKTFGEVWVVAPESQRSGKSHSVTYLEPLYVRERPGYMDGVKAYECSGVPVDCVRVGIHLLGRKPDVVLSGINSGYNISGDIQYSGTAGAALEAAFWGIHAIALSQANLDYHPVPTATCVRSSVNIWINLCRKTRFGTSTFPAAHRKTARV